MAFGGCSVFLTSDSGNCLSLTPYFVKMNMKKILFTALVISMVSQILSAQDTYSDSLLCEKGKFENWQVLQFDESDIIGGKTKTIYKLAQGDTVVGRIPFVQPEEELFAPCNVMACVVGIYKGSNTVYPEPRGDGYCARMEVKMEHVKALGVINMDVLVQGTVLTGHFLEPIRDTKAAYTKMDAGFPFTGRPRGVKYDYKAIVGNMVTRSTGFSAIKKFPDEKDYPFIAVYLQKREEDEKGRITAKRVATAYKLFVEDVEEWINGEEIEFIYGDASELAERHPEVQLKNDKIVYNTINSKGDLVPICEDGWAAPDETPTHIIVWISSSSGIAFRGGLGNTLWFDNFDVVY